MTVRRPVFLWLALVGAGLLAVALTFWAVPYVFPRYCLHQGGVLVWALSAADNQHDVPPVPEQRIRFPGGARQTAWLARQGAFSTEFRIKALNALAYYAFCGDEVELARQTLADLGNEAQFAPTVEQLYVYVPELRMVPGKRAP